MRLKINDNKKSTSVPVSLKPKHVEMLKELIIFKRATRSSVIQELIENEYKVYIQNLASQRDLI